MGKEIMNKIKIIGLVSLKPNIEPIELKYKFPESDFDSVFKLHFNRSYFDRDLKEKKGELLLESSCFVEFEDYSDVILESDIFCKQLFLVQLVKINKIIDLIRYSYEHSNPNTKLHIRNVGKDDFLYYRIDINGKNKVKHFKDNYGNVKARNKINEITNNVPFEWVTFMRAIDLLDFGFYNESLIIAFNLMDYCIQMTLKSLMVNLENDKEKEGLLRQIKEQRVKIYLGPLFKCLSGSSFYDSRLTEKSIDKINTLRNSIVHSGKDCNYNNVCDALKILHSLIKILNKKGKQDFKIPDRIIFY